MILGITGGMGCGKSAAASMFERNGFQRVDSDALVRDRVLTRPVMGHAADPVRRRPDRAGWDGGSGGFGATGVC